MVVQPRKFVVKELEIVSRPSAQEKNTSSTSITRHIKEIRHTKVGMQTIGEVDAFRLLIIALYIAKNGMERFSVPCMKTFWVANLRPCARSDH